MECSINVFSAARFCAASLMLSLEFEAILCSSCSLSCRKEQSCLEFEQSAAIMALSIFSHSSVFVIVSNPIKFFFCLYTPSLSMCAGYDAYSRGYHSSSLWECCEPTMTLPHPQGKYFSWIWFDCVTA